MTRSRMGVIGIASVVIGAAAVADGAVLCAGKGGAVKLREQCKSKEKQIDTSVLGLQTEGPKGDPGAQGPAGAAGAQGAAGAPGSPDTAAQVLAKILTVDGDASGLEADTLDGLDSSVLATVGAEAWREVGSNGEPGFNFGAGANAACLWRNFDSSFYETAAFFRDQSGMVHLKGVVKNDSAVTASCMTAIGYSHQGDLQAADSAILRLPPGYRPARRAIFYTISDNVLARLEIAVNGSVSPVSPPTTVQNVNGYLSLSGISFRCAPSGQDGCP